MDLTVGMATYRDFDGVYFTIQALRLYQDMDGVELLVVDNFGCEATRAFVEGAGGGDTCWLRTPWARPRPATSSFARPGARRSCVSTATSFWPEALARLKSYYREHPVCLDLLQGPLVNDDLEGLATHFEPVWIDQMWGTWALTRAAATAPTSSLSTSRCRDWGFFPAARPPGPVSIPVSGGSAARRGTSTKSSASSAGAACACRGCGGSTGSAGPRALPTRSACATGSPTI